MNVTTEKTLAAEKFATQRHNEITQVDKAGLPYFEHPIRVAQILQTSPAFAALSTAMSTAMSTATVDDEREDAICAAHLHDLVEDCNVTLEDLRAEGFSTATINAVALLSKNLNDGPIEQYCANIMGNPIARAVKLADLADNCNRARQALLQAVFDARGQGESIDLAKYPKVLALLAPTAEESAWFAGAITAPVTSVASSATAPATATTPTN